MDSLKMVFDAGRKVVRFLLGTNWFVRIFILFMGFIGIVDAVNLVGSQQPELLPDGKIEIPQSIWPWITALAARFNPNFRVGAVKDPPAPTQP